jgi:hypothetical protein
VSRPYDWSPLWHADPTPGSVTQTRYLASKLRTIANEIEEQSEKLKKLCTDDYWEGDAAETFRETAEDCSTKLAKAYTRYDAAAAAVSGYVEVLDAEQDVTAELLTQAQQLENDRRAAQGRLDADDPAAETERPGRADDEATVDNYFGALQSLVTKTEEARGRVQTAATTAANDLDTAINDDGLKDGRFEGAKKWVSDRWNDAKQWVRDHADIIKAIAKVASWIATVAGVAALLVSWIPIVGQALAAVLGGIALIAGAVSLLCNLALYLAGVQGITAVLVDLVGVATFGVGRAAIGGVKGAMAAVNASGKLSRAASTMGPAVLAKGGRFGDDVVGALAKGDTRLAASLSGLKHSVLKGMMGSRLGGLADDFGAGGFKHLQKVMGDAPSGFLPRGVDLKDAFNPAAVWRETAEGVRDLRGFSLSDYRQGFGDALGQLRVGDLKMSAFDLQTMNQLDHLADITGGLDNAVLNGFENTLKLQKFQFNAGFIGGLGVDGIDKFGGFEPVGDWQKVAPL